MELTHRRFFKPLWIHLSFTSFIKGLCPEDQMRLLRTVRFTSVSRSGEPRRVTSDTGVSPDELRSTPQEKSRHPCGVEGGTTVN